VVGPVSNVSGSPWAESTCAGDGIIGADGQSEHESDASAVLPFHSIYDKLPSVGTFVERSTIGPGIAGFGRGLPKDPIEKGLGASR
jgi:hypothetical protein